MLYASWKPPFPRMQLTRFRVVILLVLAVTSSSLLVWHFASGIAQPNSIVSPGSFVNTSTYTIWNNGGTYQAKDDTGNSAALTSSDIGALTNNVIAACPTTTNSLTGRTVPLCQIDYRNAPGNYAGTTTINIYDDWFVALIGENPSPLSTENPLTGNAQVITINSATGVVQLLHNPNNNLGGGTIDIENLLFKTTMNITAPTNGTPAIFALGSTATNPARVILNHVGAYSTAVVNQCFALWSNGGDDMYDTNDLWCSGTTYHALVYINVNHFYGYGPITITSTPTTIAQTDSFQFSTVIGANWQLNGLLSTGTWNGWIQDATQGSCFCFAYLSNVMIEVDQTPATFQTPGVGYRILINAPTVIERYVKGGISIDPLNNSAMSPGIFQLLQIKEATVYNALGLLKYPFGTYAVNGAATNFAFGVLYDGAAAPISGRLYTLLGVDLYNMTITGGTGVLITFKDQTGNCLVCGQSSVVGAKAPLGSTLSITFSGAPTVKMYGDLK